MLCSCREWNGCKDMETKLRKWCFNEMYIWTLIFLFLNCFVWHVNANYKNSTQLTLCAAQCEALCLDEEVNFINTFNNPLVFFCIWGFHFCVLKLIEESSHWEDHPDEVGHIIQVDINMSTIRTKNSSKREKQLKIFQKRLSTLSKSLSF